jgi:hypothetical protein
LVSRQYLSYLPWEADASALAKKRSDLTSLEIVLYRYLEHVKELKEYANNQRLKPF